MRIMTVTLRITIITGTLTITIVRKIVAMRIIGYKGTLRRPLKGTYHTKLTVTPAVLELLMSLQ